MQTLNDRSTGARKGTTMRAVTQRAYGSTEVLEVTTTGRPSPTARS